MLETTVVREFEPVPASVGQARAFLRQALRELAAGSDEDLVSTLLLVAGELTTNAVLHARTEFTVRLVAGTAAVRVEVTDGNTRVPQPCLTPAEATSGRGLAIVDGSGFNWGIDRVPEGKTVWLEALVTADQRSPEGALAVPHC